MILQEKHNMLGLVFGKVMIFIQLWIALNLKIKSF